MSSLNVVEMLRGLKDKQPWGIRLGHGSFLTMEFGKALRKKSSHGMGHGEWHLWLYMCGWRIETSDRILVGSDDSREEIQKTLDAVTFRRVREIEVASPSLDLVIHFDPDLKVSTFSSSASEADLWWLFTPDGFCLTVHGGGKYNYSRQDHQPQPSNSTSEN